MKKFKFSREGKYWYIDLPEYIENNHGTKQDLMMVAGADKMLDKLSNYTNAVTLLVSEEKPEEDGFSKLKKLIEDPFGGCTYLDGIFPIWLCKVTRWIYNGKMPDVLYYKAIN